ncbi:uncharacterized protein LOC142330638 [Lycorma delicatula]|uniref:uncharacterized protein LOC142330638 n=1 Tax=Lycorma delicatula TaxID=130591 RepID=UPI003F518BB6
MVSSFIKNLELDDDSTLEDLIQQGLKMYKLSLISFLILFSIGCDSLPSNLKDAENDKKIDVMENNEELKENHRQEKSIPFFLDPSHGAFDTGSDQEPFLLDLDEQLEAALAAQISNGQQDNEILSRARPGRPKPHSGDAFPNSPIYYIRLPPTPYMFVPGVGYVSQPPTLRPPPVQQPTDSPFINLPIHFVSNAKPTGVYTWTPPTERPIVHYPRPKPPPKDSTITNMDKGPYVFNGRPTDIFLLRNTYNSLYADALQNFYP